MGWVSAIAWGVTRRCGSSFLLHPASYFTPPAGSPPSPPFLSVIRTAPMGDSTDTTIVKLCNAEPDEVATTVNDLVSLVYLNEPSILHILDLVRNTHIPHPYPSTVAVAPLDRTHTGSNYERIWPAAISGVGLGVGGGRRCNTMQPEATWVGAASSVADFPTHPSSPSASPATASTRAAVASCCP
jgi:hypothetical protein